MKPVIFGTLFFGLTLARAEAPVNTPDLVAKGKSLYASKCLTCHGEKGDGMGPAGKYLNPKPRNFSTGPYKKGDKASDLFTTITNGLDGTAMIGFKDVLEADRWAMVYYVQTFKKK